MIAMALSCNPEILIADEPTSALDVTIQAQILELIQELTRQFGTAVILITHSLGVVAGMCNTICVMYAGRIVERGPTKDISKLQSIRIQWASFAQYRGSIKKIKEGCIPSQVSRQM